MERKCLKIQEVERMPIIDDLVSVVIPIYKVEQYLDRCVESVVNQSHSELQIILVDDGSPDNCPQMCEEWKKKDSRIEVFHKENAGLGMARNSGLDLAKGKYVTFVDSDDYIALDTIEKLCRLAKENDSDVCYYGCIDVVDGEEHTKQPPKKLHYRDEEVQREFGMSLVGNLPEDGRSIFSGASACYAFYKTSFLKKNNIRFNSEKEKYISEDLMFNVNVCSYAKILDILPESLYYYIIRKSDSLRSTYRPERFEMMKVMYQALLEKGKVFGDEEEAQLRASKYFLQAAITCVKMELLTTKKYSGKVFAIKNIVKDSMLGEVIKQYPLRRLPVKQRMFATGIRYKITVFIIVLAQLQNMKLRSAI